jgi:hypothetical protein
VDNKADNLFDQTGAVRLPQGRGSQEGGDRATKEDRQPSDKVAIVSYDEKPGIQAIATTASDLPPEPGLHATLAREFE